MITNGVDERQEEMIERLVEWISSRGLGSPAILFLEMSKPLALIGGQMLFLLQPIAGYAGPLLGHPDIDHALIALGALLEDPDGVERIVRRLERT
jgi:hypothetical protein